MPFLEIKINFNKLGDSNLSPNLVDNNNYFSLLSRQDHHVRLKKRSAYPGTFCESLSDGGFVLGYGLPAPEPYDEFLHIKLNPYGLSIERDILVTMPLFYSFVGNIFLASNDFTWVAHHTNKLSINKIHIVETLQPNPDRHTTLWDEVCILDERHGLDVKTEDLRIIPPAQRPWNSSRDLPARDPKQFSQVLKHVLDDFVAKRLMSQAFAFEVSGGIDSCLLPLHYSLGHYDQQPIIGSMIFPGNFTATQAQKLTDLASYTNLQQLSVEINPQTDYPLARFAKKKDVFYTFEEIYTEALTKLAELLQNRGVEVVSTGLGGDELFENILSLEQELKYGELEAGRRRDVQLAPFLTSEYHNDYIRLTPSKPPYPLPLLAVSLHGAQLARNNIYIEHDIWPISPLAHPTLYEFCQGLPAHFRANKNILRAFYEANRWPETIYKPVHNEHFGDFFESAVLSVNFAKFVSTYSRDSRIERMGYIDIKTLQQYYEKRVRLSERSEDNHWLFNIFTWLSLEMNLRSLN